MEIAGYGSAGELSRLLLGTQEPGRAANSRPSHPGASEDQVAISQHARDIQRLKALAEAPDEPRAARVEQIRQAIEAGTYQVSGRSVADAMIRHVLTEAVL
ncbi:flagellar biosynthesis anti-sigma factor FlgM [Nitrospira sp. Kam-Ns4a]